MRCFFLGYKVRGKKHVYIAEKLRKPITIFDLDESVCELLMSNRNVLQEFGLSCEVDNEGRLLVTGVPKCFLRNKYWDDDSRLIAFTRKLLLEMTESLMSAKTIMILPSSIHHAIATEACRGNLFLNYNYTYSTFKYKISYFSP